MIECGVLDYLIFFLPNTFYSAARARVILCGPRRRRRPGNPSTAKQSVCVCHRHTHTGKKYIYIKPYYYYLTRKESNKVDKVDKKKRVKDPMTVGMG